MQENDEVNARITMLRSAIGKPLSNSLSPFGRWLNGTLVEISLGKSVVDFVVREDMTNPGGVLHGGVIAGMFDDVMGMTVFCLGMEDFFLSLNLSIDYLSSTRSKETIRVTTQVIRKGRTIINISATMHNLDGKLLAQASSNLSAAQHIKRPIE